MIVLERGDYNELSGGGLMFKYLFIKYYRSKFFTKILIANTMIILTILIILVVIISQNVSNQIMKKELSFNTQILESVNKYYEDKLSVVRQMIEQIYYDADSYNYIFELLEKNDKLSERYLSNYAKMETFLNSNFTRDNDITNIAVYSKTNDESFLNRSKLKLTPNGVLKR